jgi:hypothetical protein
MCLRISIQNLINFSRHDNQFFIQQFNMSSAYNSTNSNDKSARDTTGYGSHSQGREALRQQALADAQAREEYIRAYEQKVLERSKAKAEAEAWAKIEAEEKKIQDRLSSYKEWSLKFWGKSKPA